MITSKTELLRSIPVLSSQETLKHILIGDYGAIIATQKLLATLNYADKTFWTQPQLIGATGEYISVLIKRSAPNQDIES
ncbi:hypothetical protein [Pseudanabaena sp. FACHB-2040]|uniref:hypothetical protein n=1 Tax=Pseudanabaena sp. FACHB-2040 TaxID=2692859 RepID=UPI001683DF4B|nr:hypothetical protein [Pseudanabaena sp. FACHB-2040]MBD2259219.1 hypothetical protein [Pseudanabaena sp. FACHB-2040]